MIACLQPGYPDENLQTLVYAAKASMVSNRLVKGEDPNKRVIQELREEVKCLKYELNRANTYIQQLCDRTG